MANTANAGLRKVNPTAKILIKPIPVINFSKLLQLIFSTIGRTKPITVNNPAVATTTDAIAAKPGMSINSPVALVNPGTLDSNVNAVAKVVITPKPSVNFPKLLQLMELSIGSMSFITPRKATVASRTVPRVVNPDINFAIFALSPLNPVDKRDKDFAIRPTPEASTPIEATVIANDFAAFRKAT